MPKSQHEFLYRQVRRRVPVQGTSVNTSLPLTKRRYINCKGVGSQEGAKSSAAQELERGMQTEFSVSGTAPGYGQMIDGVAHYFKTNMPVQFVHELAGINWPPATAKETFFISNVTYSCNVGSGPQTSIQLSHELPDQKSAK